jgi:hypothetical protein
MRSWWSRRWFELVAIVFFAGLCVASQFLPHLSPAPAGPQYVAASNAMLSIGTSGLASFLFYYLVSERSERRRRNLLRGSVESTYREAKRNIALAVIHASQKGGRKDLAADHETVEKVLTPAGFKSIFEGGREANEGYYAFQNQMSSQTYEYEEIVFNLRIIARAAERLVDSGAVDDRATYAFFIRLSTLIDRIEHNGAGYDASKPMCSFLWDTFAGWNLVEGDLGYDLIQRTIEKL